MIGFGGPRLALVVLVFSACASGSDRRPVASAGDRSDDPEFVAAREAAVRDFENQTAALEAGVYERFVHPDSIGGAVSQPTGNRMDPVASVDRSRGDPSTEMLLGTLEPPEPYNAGSTTGTSWTLQMGAYNSETGALVRVRQIQAAFPDAPTWSVPGDVYRVYLGRFADRPSAERFLEEVSRQGYSDAWVTRVR